ncbi:MAG: hypothetical protein DDT20_01117 [Firmicutes bacterium]|nr:hypothetical protein [Bacillota bacterium]
MAQVQFNIKTVTPRFLNSFAPKWEAYQHIVQGGKTP